MVIEVVVVGLVVDPMVDDTVDEALDDVAVVDVEVTALDDDLANVDVVSEREEAWQAVVDVSTRASDDSTPSPMASSAVVPPHAPSATAALSATAATITIVRRSSGCLVREPVMGFNSLSLASLEPPQGSVSAGYPFLVRTIQMNCEDYSCHW